MSTPNEQTSEPAPDFKMHCSLSVVAAYRLWLTVIVRVESFPRAVTKIFSTAPLKNTHFLHKERKDARVAPCKEAL